jgi:predicted phosphodiesterase
MELNCVCIKGNHDAALLNPENTTEYDIAPALTASLHWCALQLETVEREFLAAFIPTSKLLLGDSKSLLCFHGSPHRFTDIILPETPTGEVMHVLRDTSADIYCGGHTHLQMSRIIGGHIILNPGSVGAPFKNPLVHGSEPEIGTWAEYGLISAEEKGLSVSLKRIEFNPSDFIRTLSDSDLPVKDWWLKQYRRTNLKQ